MAAHSSQGFLNAYRERPTTQKNYFQTASRFPTQQVTVDDIYVEDEISNNKSMPVDQLAIADSINRRQYTANTANTLHWPVGQVDKDQLID